MHSVRLDGVIEYIVNIHGVIEINADTYEVI